MWSYWVSRLAAIISILCYHIASSEHKLGPRTSRRCAWITIFHPALCLSLYPFLPLAVFSVCSACVLGVLGVVCVLRVSCLCSAFVLRLFFVCSGCVLCASCRQGYVVCPSEKRFLLLFTFLKKNRKKKIMVWRGKNVINVVMLLSLRSSSSSTTKTYTGIMLARNDLSLFFSTLSCYLQYTVLL